ncbi:TetR/AcrR family transcriptional regulator [Nocardioides limicola]|uniref:TetR/AcrR family transcriptional regulator n=1 Tax=Nocardioides limicola TaxID=2803368 RepID=UPI00193C27DC|nr:TetR/AcrR family transcriptional regulator [Nocardioides sp. DJM-14]
MSTRVRLSADNRREQLLELGVRLLGTRSLEEFSIDLLAEEAGISRGLLYHYFGNKREFHTAVVQRAVEELVELTGPTGEGDAVEQLNHSIDQYLSWVEGNHAAYISIVRASAADPQMRAIREDARNQLTDRIFASAAAEELAEFGIVDTPAVRMLARGWAALVEQVVLEWIEDPRDLERGALLTSLTTSLGLILATAP